MFVLMIIIILVSGVGNRSTLCMSKIIFVGGKKFRGNFTKLLWIFAYL